MVKNIFKKRVNTRVYPRLKLINFIKYKLSSEPAPNFVIADVKNISAGGILFISKRELYRDMMLDITINFPGLEPIETKAQIIRAVRRDDGQYQIAAHFISINESVRKDLAKRIEFIIRKIKTSRSFLGRLKKAVR